MLTDSKLDMGLSCRDLAADSDTATLQITDNSTLESAVTGKATTEGENNNNQDKTSLGTNVVTEDMDITPGLELSTITSTRIKMKKHVDLLYICLGLYIVMFYIYSSFPTCKTAKPGG